MFFFFNIKHFNKNKQCKLCYYRIEFRDRSCFIESNFVKEGDSFNGFFNYALN